MLRSDHKPRQGDTKMRHIWTKLFQEKLLLGLPPPPWTTPILSCICCCSLPWAPVALGVWIMQSSVRCVSCILRAGTLASASPALSTALNSVLSCSVSAPLEADARKTWTLPVRAGAGEGRSSPESSWGSDSRRGSHTDTPAPCTVGSRTPNSATETGTRL